MAKLVFEAGASGDTCDLGRSLSRTKVSILLYIMV